MSSREKILRSAQDLFHQVGYRAASVDLIVQTCGVAKSNFYYHFKTKDDLVSAVFDLQAAEYERFVANTLHNHILSPTTRLERFCEAVEKTQSGSNAYAGCPLGNLAATLGSGEEDERAEMYREKLCAFFDHLERCIADCLQEGVDRGEFRNDIAPQELSALLLASMQGLLMMTKTRRREETLRAGLRVTIRLLQDR